MAWSNLSGGVANWVFGNRSAIGRAAIIVDSAGDEVPVNSLLTSLYDEMVIQGGEVFKIDNAATDGLAGTYNSLAYRTEKIEQHFHGQEFWWGALAGPGETNAIEKNVTRPFAAISGANTWGAAIPVIGTADVPTNAGDAYWDAHRLLVTDLDDETDPWLIRLIWGTGTSGEAIAANQYSEMMIQSNAVPGNRAGASPVEVRMPRVVTGSKLWAQVWNNTNAEVLSFFIGVHGYEG